MVALPLLPLKQDGLVDDILLERAAGSVMVIAVEATHPFTSVAVTVYEPAARLVAVGVVCPLLHRYWNGAVPPVTFIVAVPLFPPKQDTFVNALTAAVGPARLFTVTVVP